MPELVSELIVSLDMHARGTKSPGYYGYLGPEFEGALKKNSALPHRQLLGRKTYEMLNALPEANRDEGWHKTAATEGWLFSTTLQTAEWPGLKVVHDDMIGFVRKLKEQEGSELRILGSISTVREFAAAGLLDRIKLWVCPLAVPATGIEGIFDGWPDTAFDLARTALFDSRVLELEYRLAGEPPTV